MLAHVLQFTGISCNFHSFSHIPILIMFSPFTKHLINDFLKPRDAFMDSHDEAVIKLESKSAESTQAPLQ